MRTLPPGGATLRAELGNPSACLTLSLLLLILPRYRGISVVNTWKKGRIVIHYDKDETISSTRGSHVSSCRILTSNTVFPSIRDPGDLWLVPWVTNGSIVTQAKSSNETKESKKGERERESESGRERRRARGGKRRRVKRRVERQACALCSPFATLVFRK